MPSPTIIPVFSRHRHPRLRYVLKEMGKDLGYKLELITDKERWKKAEAIGKISISENFKGVKYLALPGHSFLQGGDASEEDLKVSLVNGIPAFFFVDGSPDYLACSFYLLSRYEEYQARSITDEHGRFSVHKSHANKHNYLHRPVVREWAALLGQQLHLAFPALPALKTHAWNFRPTYDIDILWAYQHRGLRGIAAGLRDLFSGKPQRAWRRLISSHENDPFNSLAFLQTLHLPPGPDEPPLKPIWFWLLTDNADRRDVNPYPIPEEQQKIVQDLAKTDTVGIHPGYLAAEAPSILAEEIKRLAAIMGVSVRHSRQHFLRVRLPDTYRALRNAGITHDYTMGYADGIGWRAGTNQSFFWYDLEREEATGLTVHPFAAMDATLKNYLKLAPDVAKREVLNLAEKVRPYGGDFMLLWHNSSFAEDYGWVGWQESYTELVMDLRRSK